MSKSFTLEVTVDERGTRIKGENKGFNAFELLGFLTFKGYDIAKQLSAMQDGGAPFMERIIITERREKGKHEPHKNENRETDRKP